MVIYSTLVFEQKSIFYFDELQLTAFLFAPDILQTGLGLSLTAGPFNSHFIQHHIKRPFKTQRLIAKLSVNWKSG